MTRGDYVKKEHLEKIKGRVDDFKKDTRLYFSKALKIRDKNANIIPFNVNWSQEQLIDIIDKHYREYPDPLTRPTLYIIILKARQEGMSTCTEGIFFKGVTIGLENDTPLNKIAVVISYDEDSAKNINEMSDRFYQYLPKVLRPMKSKNRGKGLEFKNPTYNQAEYERDPGLQSKFIIETAQNSNAGSSFTFNYLHISELAKWPRPDETMTSLLQSIPKNNAIVIVESTAKGMGNYFHRLWLQAERGENDYVPLFLPWHVHKEYTKPFRSSEEESDFILTLDDEENYLIETFNVTLEQLNWRRDTIKNKCNGSVDEFHQEYPATPEEAFLSSGSPVFNQLIINNRKAVLETKYNETPPFLGNLECKYDGNGDPIKETIKFVPNPKGWLKIYKQPEEYTPYVIGGDIAEGGKDWSVGQVIDNTTGGQVATWRAHSDTDIYAKEMYMLGHYYNNALIAIETNFDKHPVKELQRLKYYKQYRRENIDSIHNEEQQKYGFETTRTTRGPIIGELVAIARDEPELINDVTTLEEMLTFVRNKDGRPEAQEGSHDDCVMALAIAHKARSQQSMVKKAEPKKEITGVWAVGELRLQGYKDWEIKKMERSGKIKLIGKL